MSYSLSNEASRSVESSRWIRNPVSRKVLLPSDFRAQRDEHYAYRTLPVVRRSLESENQDEKKGRHETR